jgi:hypothetical protein
MADAATDNLSNEEHERMRRLAQEVGARYFEMATIMERALGSPGLRDRATGRGSQITLATKAGDDAPLEYCIEFEGEGHWEDPPGICAPGPCPEAVVSKPE